jgi:hypothetical protein
MISVVIHTLGKSITPACLVLLTCLPACSANWPKDEEAQVQSLLAGGAKGLDCYESSWMSKNKSGSHSYFADSDQCKANLRILKVSTYPDRVTGVARCKIGPIEAEYRVTVFKEERQNDRWGGYYCSSANGETVSQLAPGAVTDGEVAR